MRIHSYVYIHMYTYKFIHMYTYIYIHVHDMLLLNRLMYRANPLIYMYLFICIHTHKYIYRYDMFLWSQLIYTRESAEMCTYVLIHMYTYIYTYIYILIRYVSLESTDIHSRIRWDVLICTYSYVYIYMYLCMYVWIHVLIYRGYVSREFFMNRSFFLLSRPPIGWQKRNTGKAKGPKNVSHESTEPYMHVYTYIHVCMHMYINV